jgi:hypothetical protein
MLEDIYSSKVNHIHVVLYMLSHTHTNASIHADACTRPAHIHDLFMHVRSIQQQAVAFHGDVRTFKIKIQITHTVQV